MLSAAERLFANDVPEDDGFYAQFFGGVVRVVPWLDSGFAADLAQPIHNGAHSLVARIVTAVHRSWRSGFPIYGGAQAVLQRRSDNISNRPELGRFDIRA